MSRTMAKNTLKGVLVFLSLVGQVVAPTSLSCGQATMCVVEEDTNRVLFEYDVFMIQVLMSRSLTSLDQHVPLSWSNIPKHEEISSSILTLQRKLEEHDVLQTLIVLDTLPELLNDDLLQRAVFQTWTTLEDEEELLETHFRQKTSVNKHVVLSNGSFQSLLTQLKREPSESDEAHNPLHSADSPSKLVIMDGEPQLLRFQELQSQFGAYVRNILLEQQELIKQKPQLPRRENRQSGSPRVNIREEAATKSKVVLTRDAFQSLLKQVKLDTLQDERSHSQDVEESASKVVVSTERTTSPLMLQKEFLSNMLQTMNTLLRQSALQDQLKAFDELLDSLEESGLQEDVQLFDAVLRLAFQDLTESPTKLLTPVMHQREFLSKILSQTMSTLYGESGLQDKLKFLDGALQQDRTQSLEETESLSKLITPVMHQREFLSKILSQTMSTLYGESGLLDKLKFLDGALQQDRTQSLEETESPSKLITPVMHQREFLSKILSQTISTLYGESGLLDKLKFLDGALQRDRTQGLEEKESPSKLITPVMHQREFLSKILSQTMSTLYGESGLLDTLKFLDGALQRDRTQSLEETESPSKLITPVMHQREFFSKILSQAMSTLYGESGLQDQLKMWNGVLDETKYATAASSQTFDGVKQDTWMSQEARRETTLEGLISAEQFKSGVSSSSCDYKDTLQAVQLYTDSCYRRSGSFTQRMAGLGGLWHDKVMYHVFSAAYSNPHKLHNNDLEMLAILVGLKLHGRDWQGVNVEAYCDNESTVKLLNAYCDDTSLNVVKFKTKNRKQRSSKIQTFIINEINEEVCKYKFRLSTIQIGGKQNCRADMLSRRGIDEFSSHLPRAARYCEYDVMAELHSFDRSLESWMKTI